MNLLIFNTPDPTGKYSKEGWLSKSFPEEYNYVIDYCANNNLTNITFKEKVFLCLKEMKEVPICKNPNCLKKTKFRNTTLGYREYCSTKCISTDPTIKNSKEAKSIEKWGTKVPSQSKEIISKIISTNNEKWGGNSPMSNSEVKRKSTETLLLNYGVENPSKSKDIIQKRIESFKKSDYKSNYAATSIEKYGVDHPWKVPDIHIKTIKHFYDSYKNRILNKIKGLDINFLDFNYDNKRLIFLCDKCSTKFEIISYQFYYRSSKTPNQICTNCFPISESSSLMQMDLLNFIKENYNGEILTNVKNIIQPYEIDIFLPDLKLGFEFNGLWWHSENFKDKNYHKSKWETSIKSDIKLITVWEDDWVMKNEICKSFALNKIGKTPQKIFARKCDVRSVSYKESAEFLNQNHLQGDCKSSVRLGLYHDNEIVTLMTFGKLRLPLSSKSHRDEWELLRFVNKLNTNCIGGASKVLKYFLSNYNPQTIISYSDNLISDGNLYETLGFEFSHISEPGYWYVVDDCRQHRFNWRKSKLVSKGYDKEKTESQIMSELGHYRIFNAGNKKWEMKDIHR